IVTTYVGLVFSAMGTDYYPRLSGVSHDNAQAARLINQQSEVAILILAPILTVFLIFINIVVILIYSTKFTPVDGMIHWAALGMYFKAVSWAIAFILLAKGESKLFFWYELIANNYTLGFNIIGYKLAGLDGLGISFLVGYVVYLIQVYVLAKVKYRFRFDPEFYRVFIFQFVMGLLCFLVVKWFAEPLSYALGMPFIIIACIYSYRQMDKRMDMKSVIADIKKRLTKKQG
ncbi:MAG: polysaccharide biosynthesis C-terminal domain-containing protein, partial [Candidatus Omnitrophica bacterium]|nr:polysaccharide biosynthesis C-terminal domain-containing protein [Candidatus Omnitrophota bacterium]